MRNVQRGEAAMASTLIGKRAVVIVAGIGGLAAAGALAGHFQQVVVHRPGMPMPSCLSGVAGELLSGADFANGKEPRRVLGDAAAGFLIQGTVSTGERPGRHAVSPWQVYSR
jgi:hypothetical protein